MDVACRIRDERASELREALAASRGLAVLRDFLSVTGQGIEALKFALAERVLIAGRLIVIHHVQLAMPHGREARRERLHTGRPWHS